MRLQVLEYDFEAAVEILRGLTVDDLPKGAEDEICPYCGSADIHREAKHRGFALAALYFLSVPISRGKLEWRCETCGKVWDDEADGT